MEKSPDENARIEYLFQLVLSRPPHEVETDELLTLAHRSLDRYGKQPEMADEYLSVGEAPRSSQLDAVEHAAWATVAQAVLNLDEAINKE